MLEYILQNGGIMKLQIIINKKQSVEKIATYYEDENELQLIFKNTKEYLAFLKRRELTKDDFDSIFNSEDEIKRLLKRKDLLNSLDDAPIHIPIMSLNDVPKLLLKQKRNIILQVSKLSFQDKLTLITNPLIQGNVCFQDKYTHTETINLKDMLMMYQTICSNLKEIQDKNYSPAEATYYIYNLLKQKPYNEEGINEDINKSRSVSQILKGEKIVCAGYTNLFLMYADALNLKVDRINWASKIEEAGHSSIMIYLKDEKYKIDGIYDIDICWDSLSNDLDTLHQNSITNFLVPPIVDKYIKEKNNLVPELSPYFFILSNFKHLLKDDTESIFYKKFIIQRLRRLKETFNLNLSSDLFTIFTLQSLGNRVIDEKVLKEIIMKVTPKSEQDLQTTINSSYHHLKRTK